MAVVKDDILLSVSIEEEPFLDTSSNYKFIDFKISPCSECCILSCG